MNFPETPNHNDRVSPERPVAALSLEKQIELITTNLFTISQRFYNHYGPEGHDFFSRQHNTAVVSQFGQPDRTTMLILDVSGRGDGEYMWELLDNSELGSFKWHTKKQIRISEGRIWGNQYKFDSLLALCSSYELSGQSLLDAARQILDVLGSEATQSAIEARLEEKRKHQNELDRLVGWSGDPEIPALVLGELSDREIAAKFDLHSRSIDAIGFTALATYKPRIRPSNSSDIPLS